MNDIVYKLIQSNMIDQEVKITIEKITIQILRTSERIDDLDLLKKSKIAVVRSNLSVKVLENVSSIVTKNGIYIYSIDLNVVR